MSRTILMIVGISLTVIGLVTAATQSRRPIGPVNTETSTAQLKLAQAETTMTTQQRLNRYFHNDVIPKLKSCWSSIQGKGTIEFAHNYSKGADGKFTPAGIAVSRSGLPRGQEAVALRCMQEATRGTSFPAESSDTTTYMLNWNWPVPFPANANQLTTTMFAARVSNTGGSGGGGGCDGSGTAAKCYTCANNSPTCEKVCVGYKDCKISYPGASCTASGKCASGGPFGLSGGGRVIY